MLPVLIGLAALGILLLGRRLVARWLVLAFLHSVYRIRVRGLEHIPSGGALLVANHLSFVDALLVGAAIPRKVFFLMHRSFFKAPLIGRFASMMDTIPVAAEDTREAKTESLHRAAERATAGDLVCIFSEGGISRTGSLQPFARGLERIAQEAKVPIVPVALDRVWGSIFSYSGGRFFWKLPQRLPYPIDVAVGAPLACDAESWRVRGAVQELIARGREARAQRTRSLGYRFLRSAKKHASRLAIVDSGGTRLSYRQLLRASLALQSVLHRKLSGSACVGVLLPPSAGGALANVSLVLSGRTTVNLNYTLSNADLSVPIERAGLKEVITSRRFLAALGRHSPMAEEATIFMEDLPREVTARDKARAFALSLLPGPILARLVDPVKDGRTVLTVIFSSGSTGTPKGVVLTHANIASNAQGLAQMFSFGPEDGVLGVLPFFHSFGHLGTLWIPLICGARAVYHTNPLDAKTVGELCQKERPTVMMATPTFYQAYMKRCTKEQMQSLRLCVCGGEKLKEAIAAAWRETMEKDLYEGYGSTELSPVVAVNVPDAESLGVRQTGHKAGSVGRVLPGIAVRIVDPETRELRPPQEEGLVLVRGPNVMQGYLGESERTAEVLKDGWYETGDIGYLDRDAFLVITDRVARFSKIGGEMVPHGRVEDALHDALQRLAPVGAAFAEGGAAFAEVELVVTSVADEHKGERLVVLHTRLRGAVEAWVEELKKSDLPRLFLPRAQSFIEVESIPRLPTGKTDLRAVRDLAREKAG